MEEKVIMIFEHEGRQVDIEAPLSITANELIFGLNSGFGLNLDLSDPDNYFMRAENPIALVKGEKTLDELGLRNGSRIYF